MSNNKTILTILIACFLLTACQSMVEIPRAYNFTLKESRGNPYGCWTILNIKSEQKGLDPNTIAGELVCLEADTLYLLVADSLVKSIYSGSVIKAELITHKNQSGTYSTITFLTLVPNLIGSLIVGSEFGPDILLLGIPMAVVGLTHILIESSAHRNRLFYPEKNSLDNFKLYSRFPAGRPGNIDFKQLTLKTSVIQF